MTKGKRFKIDFVGLGAPRCGTTWISQTLKEHPDIDFAKHKETNFFLSTGIKDFPKMPTLLRPKDINEYKEEFSGKGDIKGEFSVHYLYDVAALKRIKKAFPKTKLIVSLRNPVEFSYAAYLFLRYSNAYNLLPDTFEKALKLNDKTYLFHPSYAHFDKHLKNVYEIFDKKRVHVILLDDIKDNSLTTLKELYTFLGVNNEFLPPSLNLDQKRNSTTKQRFPIFMPIINKIVEIMFSLGASKLLYDIINTDNPVRKLYFAIFKAPMKKYAPMKGETRKKLTKMYAPNILQLEKLLKRDLSAWK